MKRFLGLVLCVSSVIATNWHKVRVDLGSDVAPYLTGFEVTNVQPGKSAELIVTDQDLERLDQAGVKYQVITYDLESYYASRMSAASNFGDYYTYDEANAILDSLHEKYPTLISERMILPNDSLGDTTWDGNYVWAVKISDDVEIEESEPEILYTGLHHAREPIGANICVEWARWLLDNYDSDPLAGYLVSNREIWIVPVANPDGYLYNELIEPGGGGMHRKNRRPTGADNQGVDPNRNYPYMWGIDDVGSSPDPEEDVYRGPSPGSEPEVQSIMKLCQAHQFTTAVNFHSYSDLFLYPWGYKQEKCEDEAAFFSWGEIATRLSWYNVIGGYELYITNGDSDDWMYGETEEKPRIFSITPEVGEDFWQEWRIDQQIEENFPLLVSAAEAAGTFPELEWFKWLDQDGNIQPGETVDLIVRIRNMSVKDPSGNITLDLKSTNGYIQVLESSASMASLGPQETGTNQSDPLRVKVSSNTPDSSFFYLNLSITEGDEEFVYQITIPVGNNEVLIAEDFEDFNTDDWSTNWAVTGEDSHSGTHSITDSPGSDYHGRRTYELRPSSSIDLGDKTYAELGFWHQVAMEQGWDWGALEVRSAGTGWTPLKRWSGIQPEWREERFDLSGYCGADDVQFRLSLFTDAHVEDDGWHVDDIQLTAYDGQFGGYGGSSELVDVRGVLRGVESVTSGVLNFRGREGTKVEVKVYDALGCKVAQTNGTLPFTWDMKQQGVYPFTSGVYFVKILSSERQVSTKIVLTD
ncbi:T9SS type A sorting domain-containing protein [candidate division WOR-3 bacterium]|nr:T9SS type A sorting domain-containing protein [candidate division WOR-3 bacterium]